jgi:hypothetical protein
MATDVLRGALNTDAKSPVERFGGVLTGGSIKERGKEAREAMPTLLEESARTAGEAKRIELETANQQLAKEAKVEREAATKLRGETERIRGLEQPYQEFKAPKYTAADYAKGAAKRALVGVLLGGIAKTSALTQLKAIKAMQDAERDGRTQDFETARLNFDEAEKKRTDFNQRLQTRLSDYQNLLTKDTAAARAAAKVMTAEMINGLADAAVRSQNNKLFLETVQKALDLDNELTLESVKAGFKAKSPEIKLTEVVDPKDPSRMLRVDASVYQPGTTMGAPGVFGVSGREPKSEQARQKAEKGVDDVEDTIANFRDIYTQLQARGAITDTSKGAIDNIQAYIATTSPLQVAQRMIGGESQKLRDNIAQQRPLLVQAIRRATGMSASEMNSNVELQTYLNTATNPEVSVQANLDALDNLSRLFGAGRARRESAADGGTPSPEPAQNIEQLRQQAKAAIENGAPEQEVRKRFKQMTGKDL